VIVSTLSRQTRARAGLRLERGALFVTTGVVLALSVAELFNLGGRHTIGPETYGVLVAGVAVAAGIFSLGLVLSRQRRMLTTVAVLVLWALVALGGLAGTYYHIAGVSPEYGPADPRLRPAFAPLVFTALGVVGGAVVLVAQRAAGKPSEREG
jgi:hypothetical protein